MKEFSIKTSLVLTFCFLASAFIFGPMKVIDTLFNKEIDSMFIRGLILLSIIWGLIDTYYKFSKDRKLPYYSRKYFKYTYIAIPSLLLSVYAFTYLQVSCSKEKSQHCGVIIYKDSSRKAVSVKFEWGDEYVSLTDASFERAGKGGDVICFTRHYGDHEKNHTLKMIFLTVLTAIILIVYLLNNIE